MRPSPLVECNNLRSSLTHSPSEASPAVCAWTVMGFFFFFFAAGDLPRLKMTTGRPSGKHPSRALNCFPGRWKRHLVPEKWVSPVPFGCIQVPLYREGQLLFFFFFLCAGAPTCTPPITLCRRRYNRRVTHESSAYKARFPFASRLCSDRPPPASKWFSPTASPSKLNTLFYVAE